MNAQLGWTDLEQSKELIVAGLDPATADMMYIGSEPFMKEFDSTRKCHLRADTTKEKGRWFRPCWSLGKLIDLMPECLFDDTLIILPKQNNAGYFSPDAEGCLIPTHNEVEDTLIESVVKLIVYSLNNGYLKKVK